MMHHDRSYTFNAQNRLGLSKVVANAISVVACDPDHCHLQEISVQFSETISVY